VSALWIRTLTDFTSPGFGVEDPPPGQNWSDIIVRYLPWMSRSGANAEPWNDFSSPEESAFSVNQIITLCSLEE
jgi:hypothetical protein